MDFFVYLNGARRGPFNEERLHSFLQEGLLQPADLASELHDGELKPLSTYAHCFPAALPAAVPGPAEPAVQTPVAAAAKPTAPVQEGLPGLARRTLGPYSRATLAPNETPYYTTTLHWIVFPRFALLALLVFFFLALPFAIGMQALTGSQLGWFVLPFPVFIMVPPLLAYLSSEFVITDMRVLIKTGIIRRQTLEMFIARVASVAVDQGLFGRLFDCGTVAIRGTGGNEERFETIAHPLEFRSWVQRMQGGQARTPLTAQAGL